MVNIFEVYKTPITHYQKSYDRVCKFIRKELLQRIIEADEGHLKYLFFEMISKKGSALFKNTSNKVDLAFGKLEVTDALRLDVEKIKISAKKELDLQLRVFKEFVDLEDNNKLAHVRIQQKEHQSFRLMQELAALLLLVRVFNIKLEQEENASLVAGPLDEPRLTLL